MNSLPSSFSASRLDRARRGPRLRVAASVFLLFLFPTAVRATWFDPSWKYRRPIAVDWDADKGHDGDLATAEFYTAGHGLADGSDLRVATDEGRLIPFHVLMAGPADRRTIAFSLFHHVSRYYVYFGNDKAPAVRPDLQQIKWKDGLLLESRELPRAAQFQSFETIESAFEKSPAVLGSELIASPFFGINPFGPQDRYVSKVMGQLNAPVDGDYTIALAANDSAGLWIDGKRLLFTSGGRANARDNTKLTLTRGPHEFVLYHVNAGGNGWFTVAWIPPRANAYAVISREVFGSAATGTAEPLEEIGKEIVADFTIHYAGECFTADHYSHRYQFAAVAALKNPRMQLNWDFGDGQTAAGPAAEHVFMTSGAYPITLTVRIGANSESQTTRLEVSRDWEHIAAPPTDEPPKHSAIVAAYDLQKMPAGWLPWVVLLHQRANRLDAMLAAAGRLSESPSHSDVPLALLALSETSQTLDDADRPADMAAVLEKAPAKSDLQPQISRQLARLLMWRTGDFPHAVAVLEPFAAKGDEEIHRSYGQALVLAGHADAGKKVLEALPIKGDAAKRAAISGAQARTIEFYITQKEPEAGERAWDRWQELYPADFLEGYSVLLQTRLMELAHAPLAAAKVAEAFANAVPASSYAPQLLDRAAKLIAPMDKAKSTALHQLLKERYPEDPLSQN